MYTVPPYDYKRRRGFPLRGTSSATSRDQTHSIDTTLSTTEHPILALASINFSSSRDLEASLPLSHRLYPYYRHLQCKIIQCPRTPPCWTYGLAAGTRINLCVTVLPLASTSGTRKHATLLVGVRTAESGHRHKITSIKHFFERKDHFH